MILQDLMNVFIKKRHIKIIFKEKVPKFVTLLHLSGYQDRTMRMFAFLSLRLPKETMNDK